MQIDAPRALIQMTDRLPLRMTDARGMRLRGVAGTTWVTIDDDPRDVLLEPGDELVIDSDRPVYATALRGCATLAVSSRRRAAGSVPPSLLGGVLQRAARRLGTAARPVPA